MSKLVSVRSPYFITINESGQVQTKIELFIWHKGETEPTLPNYTRLKDIPSTTQTETRYNISSFVKGFINISHPVNISTPTEESVNNWVNFKVKRYYRADVTDAWTLLDTTSYVGLNAYTSYIDGLNDDTTTTIKPLINDYKIYISSDNYINCWLDTNTYAYVTETDTIEFTVATSTLYKLPVADGGFYLSVDDGIAFTVSAEKLCEPKYTPVVCSFINRLGGWNFLTFFKAKSESLEFNNKTYDLLPDSLDYDIYRGQSQTFNYDGKRSIKLNTGWVDEDYSTLMEDLLSSETILINSKPAKLKTLSTPLKSILQDKMINYEIEFEYNYNLINNVV